MFKQLVQALGLYYIEDNLLSIPRSDHNRSHTLTGLFGRRPLWTIYLEYAKYQIDRLAVNLVMQLINGRRFTKTIAKFIN